MTTILVTGVAGFIGSWTAKKLLEKNNIVIGIDNINDYYNTNLKKDRIHWVKKSDKNNLFTFIKCDFSNYEEIKKIFKEFNIDKICHLGAQAGVRYSIENPFSYIKSNIDGTINLLECARHNKIKTFVYASSSSIYGNNKKVPFSITDNVDKPISLYAATKKSNELMAYTYHHLYGLQCTGLRFFTVYGPMGRPDMALFKFTKAILEDKSIKVYNYGKMKRDFTYITDIVDGIITALDKSFDYEIFNLGNSNTVELNYFIEIIEKEIGKKANKILMPIQPGDVLNTFADIEHSQNMLNFNPKIKIEEGIKEFIKWYKGYYQIIK